MRLPPFPLPVFQHTDLGPELCALCTTGDEHEVRALLDDSDTDVNVTDSTGETPLHKACHASKLHIIKLLLQQDGIVISKGNNNGQTPLHIVSKVGNVEAAQLLLEAESKESNAVNSPDNRGLTPLCYSAKFSKDIQVVNFLRERYVTVRYILYSVVFSIARESLCYFASNLLVNIHQNHCYHQHITLISLQSSKCRATFCIECQFYATKVSFISIVYQQFNSVAR